MVRKKSHVEDLIVNANQNKVILRERKLSAVVGELSNLFGVWMLGVLQVVSLSCGGILLLLL